MAFFRTINYLDGQCVGVDFFVLQSFSLINVHLCRVYFVIIQLYPFVIYAMFAHLVLMLLIDNSSECCFLISLFSPAIYQFKIHLGVPGNLRI